jgi:GNAT superfamily N-acetyltransferase
MTLSFVAATSDDAATLAELRIRAMRPSLEAIGRFDPLRAKNRFLQNFDPSKTLKINFRKQLVGFFVVENRGDHLWLDHLYIDPEHQGNGFGHQVLEHIKALAQEQKLPINLGALRGSDSNRFYQAHGFRKTHEEEWDIYYQWG